MCLQMKIRQIIPQEVCQLQKFQKQNYGGVDLHGLRIQRIHGHNGVCLLMHRKSLKLQPQEFSMK